MGGEGKMAWNTICSDFNSEVLIFLGKLSILTSEYTDFVCAAEYVAQNR